MYPNRFYIGSAIHIKHRWVCHLFELKRNIHTNKILQNHFNKYGESDLIFKIIEPCFPQFLLCREQEYIDNLTPYFNICKIASNCLGRIVSEETKKKQSDNRKGKYSGENHPFYGKHQSEESKESMSNSHIGLKQSKETINKRVIKNTGKKRTVETKQKMSNSQLARDFSYKIGKKINSKTTPFHQYIKDKAPIHIKTVEKL
jgi:group I intron endonuclease